VVGVNLSHIIREHDRSQFEVFCYSAVNRPDAVTDFIRQHTDHWKEIAQLDDPALAQTIRDDEIDVLVDLALHSVENHLLIFARQPAPVQITYLGYCSTSGLEAMHYRLSDPYFDPPETDLTCYSETTIRLPETYFCYLPRAPLPPPVELPALANRHVTFGCLNNFAKVSSEALDVWARILAEIPTSRMLLYLPPAVSPERGRQLFTDRGIDPNRIEFAGRQTWEQYMHTYDRIDIALDPFPFGGGITSCDAIWMGVPLITLSGRTAVGRGGRSVLSNVGLQELVTYSPAQYGRLAVELASNAGRLAELRRTLRPRMLASPLTNAKRFAQNIEAAYRQAWTRWGDQHRET
jgi:predicted O-linked N-acetylglucosamine transferase (SPINDLY family)